MRSSESTSEIFKALAEFQGEMPIVPKLHTADMGSFSYSYADLGDAVEAAKSLLKENGLAVVQMSGWEDGHDTLDTRVTHQSGQWIEGTARVPYPSDSPQVVGSAMTYFRRYQFCAALRIVADEDNDGALAAAAYDAANPRATRRSAPRSSTSTKGSSSSSGSRGRVASVPEGSPGTAMSSPDRNKITSHFAHLTPPLIEGGMLSEIQRLLELPEQPEALAKLDAVQGAKLKELLGIE